MEQEHETAVEVLLQAIIAAGMNIDSRYEGNARDKQGQTLMRASALGLTTAVSKLLALGTDFAAKDKKGNSCLHIAAAQGSLDSLSILLQAGADVAAKNQADHTAVELAKGTHTFEVLKAGGSPIRRRANS